MGRKISIDTHKKRESQETGFDIGFCRQVSASEKQEMLKELCVHRDNNNVTADFFLFNDPFANEYFDVVSS